MADNGRTKVALRGVALTTGGATKIVGGLVEAMKNRVHAPGIAVVAKISKNEKHIPCRALNRARRVRVVEGKRNEATHSADGLNPLRHAVVHCDTWRGKLCENCVFRIFH